MTTRQLHSLRSLISEEITCAEQRFEHKLTPEDRQFLHQCVEERIFFAINKFVRGAKEHNNQPIEHRNPLLQASEELVDADFYIAAAVAKLHKF